MIISHTRSPLRTINIYFFLCACAKIILMKKKLSFIFFKIGALVSAVLVFVFSVIGARSLVSAIIDVNRNTNILLSALCIGLLMPFEVACLLISVKIDAKVCRETNKEKVRKYGIASIIAGIGNVFGIISGIIILGMSDEELAEPLEFRNKNNPFVKFFAMIGLEDSSPYVKNYLNEANMRSGIFMSAVIIILEIWLLYYQFHEHIIPEWADKVGKAESPFHYVFTSISIYVLFLLVCLTMLVYFAGTLNKRRSQKKRFLSSMITGGITASYCFFIFFESSLKSWKADSRIIWLNSLLIVIYSCAFIFSLLIIALSATRYLFKKDGKALLVLMIVFFSVICLVFGFRVSYNDYFRGKEIICYLTMMIYVACLLIWKPYTSVSIVGAVASGFYLLIKSITPVPYAGESASVFQEGDRVNYITFFISLAMVSISIYNQRINEGEKDERLEQLATIDELSGLFTYAHFINEAEEILKEKNDERKDKIILFLNVVNFKSINDQKGFAQGNNFLRALAEIIRQVFANDISSRVGDDHFVVLTSFDGVEEKIIELKEKTLAIDIIEGAKLEVGGYLPTGPEDDLRRGADKARYASSLKPKDNHPYVIYDKDMHNGYHKMQYIIHNVENAVHNGWLKVYYQPVVWSKNRKLCGAEALARWIDPKYGFLSPGEFIPVLENNRLIHILDAGVYEIVCRDIRAAIDEGKPVIPISINFSRLDFELMDAVQVLDDLMKKYNVPKEYIHVEITESALIDDLSSLNDSINRLKKEKYALWLDDFGSGYSSLNVLKDYEFDVLKIDMKFLSGFHEKPKSKIVIQSVINMAKDLGIKTLAEGVETDEEVDFLKNVGCERLQGYHFGKPIPKDELLEKIKSGELPLGI